LYSPGARQTVLFFLAPVHSAVQECYGSTQAGTGDLRTDACCDASAMPEPLKPLLARIHPEVLERYYGCWIWAAIAAGMETCWPSLWGRSGT
jgi:hypothetical protein